MDTTMTSITSTTGTAEFLAGFGLETAPGRQVAITDWAKAERCYVHHSSMPVALMGYSLVSAAFAKGRFPKVTLQDLVTKRPSMDESEAVALAALAGVDVEPPFWGRPPAFSDHLFDVLARHKMEPFFTRTDDRSGRGGHYSVRPTGIDWRTDEDIAGALTTWRRQFKALPPVDQMMVATVMWLYRGGEDRTWMVRVPNKWLAPDAIVALRAAGYLADFVRLVALYPGW